MKNLILIALTVLSFNVYGQLVIKEAPKDTIIWQATKLSPIPKIIKYGTDSTATYSIFYRNAKYTTITDVNYITTGDLETTKQFYQLGKTVIAENKEYNIEMDGKSIFLSKGMGSLMIWMTGSYFYLSEKNIDAILEKLK